MKKRKLKIKVINPPSEKQKEKLINELKTLIQENYYS